MAYTIDRVDVWVAPIEDRPGGLNNIFEALSAAGANLEFIVARRAPEEPGMGVVFVAPIRGVTQSHAARSAKLTKANSLFTLRIEGPDKPGLGTTITSALAEANINLRGMTGASLGRRSALYLGFDNSPDATKATRILKKLLPAK